MAAQRETSPEQFLRGGGEMGERIRALDWSATPLGPVSGWPQSLRSPLSMLLPSKAQIILFWGPEFVVFYNDAYRPVFGAKHPQALGMPGRLAWSEIWEGMLGDLLEGVLRTGEAFWAKDLLFLLQRHGFAEETYFDVSYDPVRDESGSVGGVFCIVTETTARVVGERRLALLRDLAARNAAARSAREACALAIESLAGHPHDLLFAEASLDGALQAATPGAAAARAAARPQDVRELPLPGGALVVGVNARRPFDDAFASFLDLVGGQVATGIANARVHEEERRRAEALAELDRAKTAFFSNVSHEFRTPLTLLLGPVAELLERAPEGGERALLEIVQRNALRLLKLVNTLLDFARIEAGRVQARFEPVDLCGLTRELASTFRAACDRAGLRLDVRCDPLPEPVFVDREMWEKVVLNLLSNAFKFTHRGGIEVRLDAAAEHARLTVRDTGIGIPAAELAHVFDRFHRVEGARGRSHEGSGIGLALVRELVRLHGGEVTVESAAGRGTTFAVTVPRGSAHLPAERLAPRGPAATSGAAPFVSEALSWLPADGEAAAGGAPADAARVLVADDNADLRDYVRRLLGETYDVRVAADGREALRVLRAWPADLLVTDVMMPGLDGLGLLRAVREDPKLRQLPVLVLSARAGEESRLEGLERGADDYLPKPFGARELLVRCGALLRSAEIRRQSLEALRAADRRKDEFLATLSHELRNPLAPLRNALHLLGSGDCASPPDERVRQLMERQVNHLVRLVDDLLEVSRITRGVLELRREPVELSSVVRNAVETSEPLIQEARHRLEVSLPGEPLWLAGDPVRLAQVLANLLNNAARYTPEGGTLALAAARAGGEAEIRVRDDGRGIAPENLERVFEMFTREDRADARAPSGLGIGLTLARRLAEMHGGSITAHSEGADRGAEFVVRLPLAAESPRPGGARRALRRLPAALRVLLVDDNRDAAESLALLLGRCGAAVRQAHDGAEALAAAAADPPDVVLLDIGLPDLDGYEVARRLAERLQPRPPVLMAITGWGQEEHRRQSRAVGIAQHLVKPVDVAALLDLLAAVPPRGSA